MPPLLSALDRIQKQQQEAGFWHHSFKSLIQGDKAQLYIAYNYKVAPVPETGVALCIEADQTNGYLYGAFYFFNHRTGEFLSASPIFRIYRYSLPTGVHFEILSNISQNIPLAVGFVLDNPNIIIGIIKVVGPVHEGNLIWQPLVIIYDRTAQTVTAKLATDFNVFLNSTSNFYGCDIVSSSEGLVYFPFGGSSMFYITENAILENVISSSANVSTSVTLTIKKYPRSNCHLLPEQYDAGLAGYLVDLKYFALFKVNSLSILLDSPIALPNTYAVNKERDYILVDKSTVSDSSPALIKTNSEELFYVTQYYNFSLCDYVYTHYKTVGHIYKFADIPASGRSRIPGGIYYPEGTLGSSVHSIHYFGMPLFRQAREHTGFSSSDELIFGNIQNYKPGVTTYQGFQPNVYNCAPYNNGNGIVRSISLSNSEGPSALVFVPYHSTSFWDGKVIPIGKVFGPAYTFSSQLEPVNPSIVSHITKSSCVEVYTSGSSISWPCGGVSYTNTNIRQCTGHTYPGLSSSANFLNLFTTPPNITSTSYQLNINIPVTVFNTFPQVRSYQVPY